MTSISTNVGENPLEEMEQALQSKSPKHILECNLKNDRMITICFQGKPFSITLIQVYTPTTNAKEAKDEWFYEDLQDLELTPRKKKSFSSQENGMQELENQEIPEVTGKLALEYKMKQGKG